MTKSTTLNNCCSSAAEVGLPASRIVAHAIPQAPYCNQGLMTALTSNVCPVPLPISSSCYPLGGALTSGIPAGVTNHPLLIHFRGTLAILISRFWCRGSGLRGESIFYSAVEKALVAWLRTTKVRDIQRFCLGFMQKISRRDGCWEAKIFSLAVKCQQNKAIAHR